MENISSQLLPSMIKARENLKSLYISDKISIMG